MPQINIYTKEQVDALVSSGSEWEELNLSSLPTNFNTGDEIKVYFKKLSVSGSNGTDWNGTSLTATGLGVNDTDCGVTKEYIIGSTDYKDIIFLNNYDNYSISGITITIPTTTVLNTGSTIFDVSCYRYNGCKMASTTAAINRTNVSTYINKIYIKRVTQ